MKRSPMPPSTKPMKRSTFKPKDKKADKDSVVKTLARHGRLTERHLDMRHTRSGLKSKGPVMTPIRKAARGQDCTLRIPGVCNWNPETTVLCHSPYLESGRGMGLKAPDEEACFGCSSCHDMLDRRTPWSSWMTPFKMDGFFIKAMNATHVILKAKGLIP